jgi:hypothetical protein
MSVVIANPLQILADGYGRVAGITDDGRLKVDVHSVTEETTYHIYPYMETILESLDGYYPYTLGHENDLAHNSAIYTILQALDGYATAGTDLGAVISAINTILNEIDGYALDSVVQNLIQNLNEYKTGTSNALHTILQDLDGYALDKDLHEVNNALQTVINELDGYIEISEKGAASGVATLDSGGKIPASQMPAVALPEVHVVYDDAERLALNVQEGDEAIQTEDGYHYIYDGYNWYERPVHEHAADHSHGAEDEIIAQNLGSGNAEEGKILVANGEGGWTVEDNHAESSISHITHQMAFTKNGSITNAWMSYYENSIPSNNVHGIVPWKSKLIGITFSNTYSSRDVDIKVYVAGDGDGNSPLTKALEWQLRNVRVAYKTDFSPDILFDAGDKVAIFMSDQGSNPHDPVIVLHFQVTTDATTGSGSEDYSNGFSLGGGTTS